MCSKRYPKKSPAPTAIRQWMEHQLQFKRLIEFVYQYGIKSQRDKKGKGLNFINPSKSNGVFYAASTHLIQRDHI